MSNSNQHVPAKEVLEDLRSKLPDGFHAKEGGGEQFEVPAISILNDKGGILASFRVDQVAVFNLILNMMELEHTKELQERNNEKIELMKKFKNKLKNRHT